MAAHLSRGRLNLGFLRELARKELLESLDKCHGTKALVWDDQLIGPCSLFAEYALLKDHDVTKMFTIHSGRLPQADVQHIIFLTRAQVPLMEIIAENIIKEESNSTSKDFRHKEFHIFFVPRKNFLCDKKLKDLGVFGSFANLEDINVELYPYDSDLITMELDYAYRECHLDGDMTSMYHVAKSLMTLQSLYGLIPHVYGQGKCAKHVYDLMVRMRRELAGNDPQITSQIDALLIIDREVDLLSPLVTQLTYEGLIDEIFGINSTIVKLPPEKFIKGTEGGPQEIPTEQKIVLNSSEDMYAELRKCNFNAIGPTLSKKAKLISAQFEERHGAKTVGEIKQFVAKLPHMQAAKQSLANHTAIAELIKEVATSDDFLETVQIEHEFLNTLDTDKPNAYIEECIVKQDPLLKVLRMICIQSFTNSGLKSKVLDYYKKEILQTYGYHHLLTLQNLEKAGLLRVQDQRTYQVLRKTLRLTEEAVDEQDPKDVTYVHSGYAPIGVRLAQHLARSGSWRNIQDALRLLPGPTIEEVQQVPLGLRKRRGSGSSIQSSTEDQKVTLVFFLGGCTYAEIAALRFLSIQEDYPTEYVVATTKIINGKTFVDSLTEKLQPDCTPHQPL